MNFFESLQSKNLIDENTEVIFVADVFVDSYVGGAELTSDALIQKSPFRLQKILCKDVTKDILLKNKDKCWLFGNMTNLDPNLISVIVQNCSYAIIEYDYKFCEYRSVEKHFVAKGSICDCDKKPIGNLISTFFENAKMLFWMSEKQQQTYCNKFISLRDVPQIVLSSVFDESFFSVVSSLRKKYESTEKNDWIVQKSSSWIKGSDVGVEFCKKNNLQYKEVSNLSYNDLLEELAKAKGFVFLPQGGDTCPRIVIEAKLLGCDLVLNDHVQHAKECWFDTDDLLEIEEYLKGAADLFWNLIKKEIIEYSPSISGYTTTYNCISQKYPFQQSIQSMIEFCNEVVVVDGGSTDRTWETLLEMQENLVPMSDRLKLFDSNESRLAYFNEKSPLKLKQIPRDWNHPRFAVFDGQQKAEARKLCTGNFCWQMDSDEIVHENDYEKIKNLAINFPKGANLISLPVVEYWGGPDKVRLDITPWKWRMSKNIPSITHGIPKAMRIVDESGFDCATTGTDGCDMIHSVTGEPIPFIGFYTNDANNTRLAALQGNVEALKAYENWFQHVVDNLPGVHHFSWFDLERKIKTYKNYWTAHWESLSGKKYSDTAESNMFFDLPWSEVTDEMISQKAKELASIGGWIWHSKWKGQKTPWLVLKTTMPLKMKS